ncbi:MAG TPA: VWA domain-containing protein, partial [Pyrinomonadaceae bacterium]
MFSHRSSLLSLAFILLFFAAPFAAAQDVAPTPSPTPSPAPDVQDQVKVFTEEVRLPIFVRDERGRFDPTLEMSDVVVVEDDVPQEIRSLRRLPASVLILIDTNNTVDFLSKTTTARDLAWQIISNLHAQDQVALMQFADRTELLQDWTTDRDSLKSVLRTKLHSGRREYLGAAIEAAAEALQTRPAGSRQVVLITDGMETPGGKVT